MEALNETTRMQQMQTHLVPEQTKRPKNMPKMQEPLLEQIKKTTQSVVRICKQCNKEFVTKQSPSRKGRGIYCSRKCVNDAQTKTIIKTCENCKKQFETKSYLGKGKRIFCSTTCSTAKESTLNGRKWAGEWRTCEICKKEFWLTRYFVNIAGKGRFCSKKCMGIDREKQTTVKCETCGKQITKAKSIIERHQHNYCTKECWAKSMHVDRIKQTCKNCGKTYKVIPSKQKSMFCSKTCAFKYLRNENSPHWKGGTSYEPYCIKFNDDIKEMIRIEHDRTCFMCKEQELEKEKLSIHHVDYQKSQGCKGLKWSLIPMHNKCHIRTNHNRWYWFALLRDYWIYKYEGFTFYPLNTKQIQRRKRNTCKKTTCLEQKQMATQYNSSHTQVSSPTPAGHYQPRQPVRQENATDTATGLKADSHSQM